MEDDGCEQELYDNKICVGEKAAECRACLGRRVAAAGYTIVTDVGHVKKINHRQGSVFKIYPSIANILFLQYQISN